MFNKKDKAQFFVSMNQKFKLDFSFKVELLIHFTYVK